MPTQHTVRHAWTVVAITAFISLPAPGGAAAQGVELPCVPNVTCPDGQPQPQPEPKPKPRPGGCANADLQPARGNLRRVRRATLCLLNRQRTRHHLPRLHANRPLRRVATRYARTMVAQSFFDHVTPGGTTFVQRIQRGSTYLRDANGYEVGENLAWGGGTLSTPRRIVRSWMASPGHRANVLKRAYRDIGVGVALGTPVGSGPGATYVNEFGRRGTR